MKFLSIKKAWSHFHRRKRSVESYDWWAQLNYAQKFSVSSLYQLGYEMKFVRTSNHQSIAYMFLSEHIVTIDQDGLINTEPEIVLRKNS